MLIPTGELPIGRGAFADTVAWQALGLSGDCAKIADGCSARGYR